MYKEKAASKSKTEVITCRSRGYWYHGTTVPTVLAGTYLLRYGTTMYRGTMVP